MTATALTGAALTSTVRTGATLTATVLTATTLTATTLTATTLTARTVAPGWGWRRRRPVTLTPDQPEPQLGGAADLFDDVAALVTGDLDQDLPVATGADLRCRYAGPVDALADDVAGLGELLVGRVATLAAGLQDDSCPTLQVEP